MKITRDWSLCEAFEELWSLCGALEDPRSLCGLISCVLALEVKSLRCKLLWRATWSTRVLAYLFV